MREISASYQDVWKTKPILRTVYGDIFDRIGLEIVKRRTLEIGGGIGNLKSRLDDVISSDIQFGHHLDLVADAQELPFASGSLSNIVMLDVLHHIEFPSLFFKEAARVLCAGGRIVMVEPAITPGSSLFYRFVHQEPVDMSVNPLRVARPDHHRDPFYANQAVPTLIATKYQRLFCETFPSLKMHPPHWLSFFVYPLSGGFQPWSVIPNKMAKVMLKFEKRIEHLLGRIAAFRMLLVVEKDAR